MAIFKITPGEMHELEMTYAVIPSESLDSIRTSYAVAIYTYLLDKPEDWIIRRRDVLNRFSDLGRRRYENAIRELKEAGLLVKWELRNDFGQFTSDQLDLFALPAYMRPDAHETMPSVATRAHKTVPSVTNSTTDAHETHAPVKPPAAKPDGGETCSLTHNRVLPITDSLHITDGTHGTDDADAFPVDKFFDSEDLEPTPPSEEKSEPVTKSRFDDLCREMLGGIDPGWWNHLASHDFRLKDGTRLSGEDHLREVLAERLSA